MLFIKLFGYPLSSRCVLNSLMLSSNIPFDEFVLRSLIASPLTKPFSTPGGWHIVNNVYWYVFVGFKWSLMLTNDSLLNLSPL